jgi:hypothetical protein
MDYRIRLRVHVLRCGANRGTGWWSRPRYPLGGLVDRNFGVSNSNTPRRVDLRVTCSGSVPCRNRNRPDPPRLTPMQQSSPHWSRKLGDGFYVVMTSIILCVAIAAVFPYLITEFALLNVNASPTIPWFLAPSAGVCTYAVVLGNYLCNREKIATRISLASSFFMLILGVIGLLLLSLALTRWYGYHFNQIALPGDKFATSNGMRAFISLAKLGAAGP